MSGLKKLKTTPAPFISRDMEGVTWVEPKLVCEVVYQLVTRDCRLRMPRLHTLRNDKERMHPRPNRRQRKMLLLKRLQKDLANQLTSLSQNLKARSLNDLIFY